MLPCDHNSPLSPPKRTAKIAVTLLLGLLLLQSCAIALAGSQRSPPQGCEVKDATLVSCKGYSGLELDISNTRITHIQPGAFDSLTSLTKLSLSSNQLTTLPPGIFDSLTSLTALYLHSNQLTTLPPGIFDSLTSLTWLGLSSNQLTSLPPGIFDSLTSLTGLYLSRNQLTTLPPGIFDSLTSLTELDLYSNQLTSLPPGIFDGLTSLTKLSLSSNQLATLPPGIFDSLTSLTQLYLHSNQLTTLPLGIFDSLTSLTELGLNSNQLTTLPAGILDSLTSLVGLYLRSNQLTTLPPGIFDSLTSLTRLYLRSNQLTTLSPGIFDSLTSLTRLTLHSNQLTSLPAGILDSLTSLTWLDLYSNPLTTVPSGIFDSLTSLTRLTLDDPPSRCPVGCRAVSRLGNRWCECPVPEEGGPACAAARIAQPVGTDDKSPAVTVTAPVADEAEATATVDQDVNGDIGEAGDTAVSGVVTPDVVPTGVDEDGNQGCDIAGVSCPAADIMVGLVLLCLLMFSAGVAFHSYYTSRRSLGLPPLAAAVPVWRDGSQDTSSRRTRSYQAACVEHMSALREVGQELRRQMSSMRRVMRAGGAAKELMDHLLSVIDGSPVVVSRIQDDEARAVKTVREWVGQVQAALVSPAVHDAVMQLRDGYEDVAASMRAPGTAEAAGREWWRWWSGGDMRKGDSGSDAVNGVVEEDAVISVLASRVVDRYEAAWASFVESRDSGDAGLVTLRDELRRERVKACRELHSYELRALRARCVHAAMEIAEMVEGLAEVPSEDSVAPAPRTARDESMDVDEDNPPVRRRHDDTLDDNDDDEDDDDEDDDEDDDDGDDDEDDGDDDDDDENDDEGFGGGAASSTGLRKRSSHGK